jgi:small subunit ribosomal protein S5
MGKKNLQKASTREREQKEFDEEVLEIGRVTRVVKGGRRLRFRCTVAIGDRKGRVAVGIGKSSEVVNGIKKAVTMAKKNLFRVPIAQGDTIPHTVNLKYKAVHLLIRPAAPGTGVIAGGALRKILNLSGIKNVLSKNFGSRNTLVMAQATMKALKKLKPARKAAASAKEAPSNEMAKKENADNESRKSFGSERRGRPNKPRKFIAADKPEPETATEAAPEKAIEEGKE